MRISDWSSDVCSSDLLANPEIGEGTVLGREAGADRKLAGRLLRDIDVDDRLVRLGTWNRDDFDALELSPVPNVGFRAAQLGGVEGVALHQLHLAPDDLVHRPNEIGRASCRERGGKYV